MRPWKFRFSIRSSTRISGSNTLLKVKVRNSGGIWRPSALVFFHALNSICFPWPRSPFRVRLRRSSVGAATLRRRFARFSERIANFKYPTNYFWRHKRRSVLVLRREAAHLPTLRRRREMRSNLPCDLRRANEQPGFQRNGPDNLLFLHARRQTHCLLQHARLFERMPHRAG